MLFNEDTFEQAIIELFENMDYTHIYAPDMNGLITVALCWMMFCEIVWCG